MYQKFTKYQGHIESGCPESLWTMPCQLEYDGMPERWIMLNDIMISHYLHQHQHPTINIAWSYEPSEKYIQLLQAQGLTFFKPVSLFKASWCHGCKEAVETTNLAIVSTWAVIGTLRKHQKKVSLGLWDGQTESNLPISTNIPRTIPISKFPSANSHHLRDLAASRSFSARSLGSPPCRWSPPSSLASAVFWAAQPGPARAPAVGDPMAMAAAPRGLHGGQPWPCPPCPCWGAEWGARRVLGPHPFRRSRNRTFSPRRLDRECLMWSWAICSSDSQVTVWS